MILCWVQGSGVHRVRGFWVQGVGFFRFVAFRVSGASGVYGFRGWGVGYEDVGGGLAFQFLGRKVQDLRVPRFWV